MKFLTAHFEKELSSMVSHTMWADQIGFEKASRMGQNVFITMKLIGVQISS